MAFEYLEDSFDRIYAIAQRYCFCAPLAGVMLWEGRTPSW